MAFENMAHEIGAAEPLSGAQAPTHFCLKPPPWFTPPFTCRYCVADLLLL